MFGVFHRGERKASFDKSRTFYIFDCMDFQLHKHVRTSPRMILEVRKIQAFERHANLNLLKIVYIGIFDFFRIIVFQIRSILHIRTKYSHIFINSLKDPLRLLERGSGPESHINVTSPPTLQRKCSTYRSKPCHPSYQWVPSYPHYASRFANWHLSPQHYQTPTAHSRKRGSVEWCYLHFWGCYTPSIMVDLSLYIFPVIGPRYKRDAIVETMCIACYVRSSWITSRRCSTLLFAGISRRHPQNEPKIEAIVTDEVC